MNTSSERFEREAGVTPHVIVRASEASDMEAIAGIMNQPGVRRGTLGSGYRTVEATTAWFAKLPKGTISLCAELNGQVVGHAGIEIAPPRRAHSAVLGISVHDDFQGRGVGTALLGALVECADLALGLRRLELTVFVDNAAAIALYRRFGFVEEGRSRGYAMRDGLLADVLHMARLADAPSFVPH
ncbi:GNAT family N-acetyltransferase [Paraburkholderia phenazinium]|jgi:putative acetyltransferase|uniref:Putative acetyltransferase n=1 Tax=Paraburkholderia phenazinium TaxID=60549 RepID=A0A1G7ZWJ9_9BURK|nr:GNAT family N-acetyltransferase [Paraburkholderia phenazinium]SDH13048.1 putative acetyltransferase [Paraburkholderia phenazinium]